MRGFLSTFVFAALIGGAVWGLYAVEPEEGRTEAPPSAPIPEDDEEIGGEPLPPQSDFDPEVWVAVPELAPSSGTAFAIGEGVWMTARHVVEGCSRVVLEVQASSGVAATDQIPAENADVAILASPLKRTPLEVDLDADEELRLGAPIYFIGYPKGLPGEVTGQLLGRETMQQRGRYMTREPVLAWAESARTEGIEGHLGGLSGGPGFDRDGQVIGVTVAHAPRRGRIYTAAPSSLAAAIARAGADAGLGTAGSAERVASLSNETFGEVGRRLRRDLRVAKVQCVVE